MESYKYKVHFYSGEAMEIASALAPQNFCGHLCLAGDFVMLGEVIYAKSAIEYVELL